MGKYRIKIETNKNGDKFYYAQYGYYSISNFGFLKWFNLYLDGTIGKYAGQSTIKDSYRAIEARINKEKIEEGRKIINIEYKDV